MSIDSARLTDEMIAVAGYQRPAGERLGLWGYGVAEVHGPDGELKQRVEFANLVTQIGDQYYGERAAPITSPPAAVTGMQLGTGTTAVAKTGAGAALVTLVTSSLVAQTGTPASALNGSSRRITYVTTWAAGTATSNGISEVVLTNQAVVTQTIVPSANTISRAVLSPVVNKGASDSLTITWNHDLLGA
jgi:hypothetical protein